jgi:hypothetical protein
MANAQKTPATLIPGDGIGPEITAPFQWDRQQGGLAA